MKSVLKFSGPTVGYRVLSDDFVESRSRYKLRSRGPAVTIDLEWDQTFCPSSVHQQYDITFCPEEGGCHGIRIHYPIRAYDFQSDDSFPIVFFKTYTATIRCYCHPSGWVNWSKRRIFTGPGGECWDFFSWKRTLMGFRDVASAFQTRFPESNMLHRSPRLQSSCPYGD